MSNLKHDLLELVGEEPIEAIIVGLHHDDLYQDEPDQKRSPKKFVNRVLTPEIGLALLDYEYDSGFGGADCHPFYAYTKSRIYFVHEYDGATGIHFLPRNPIDVTPDFDGEDSWSEGITPA